MTYTYAILDVSPETFSEIAGKLKAAAYDHAFHREDARTVIDMHGIALANHGSASPLRAALEPLMDRLRHALSQHVGHPSTGFPIGEHPITWGEVLAIAEALGVDTTPRPERPSAKRPPAPENRSITEGQRPNR